MQHVFERLRIHAELRGEQIAFTQVTPLCSGTVTMTYGQLYQTVTSMSAQLAQTRQPGDVVVLCAYNRPEYVAGFLAALAANLTVFPLYPSSADAELRDAAIRSSASAFLGLADRYQAVASLGIALIDVLAPCPTMSNMAMPAQSDRSAMLLQSSGTTGSPKIVRRSGEALDAVARNVAEAIGLRSEDQVLAAIPLCHSYGVEHGLLGPVYAGCTVHLCDTFDTRMIVPQLRQRGTTVYPGTPFMFEMLAEVMNERSAPELRLAYSAGATLPASVADAFCAVTKLRIGQVYGSTEVGSVTFNDPTVSDFDSTTVGLAMDGVDLRILDAADPHVDTPLPHGEEGHVAIAAPSMLERYVDDSEPALVNGYFMTGDLGRLDEGGRLTITGRVKLQIDIGGLKVNPLEIERVLMAHPMVAECVVVPSPVTATLDRLMAIVTPRDPASPPMPDDLRAFARSRLSRHKIPRIFEVRQSLPRTASGKIMRGSVICG